MPPTELEHRESRRRTATLYDHPSTRAKREEKLHKPDEADGLRRQHADERDALATKHHVSLAELRHKHSEERAGPRRLPGGLDERQAAERDALVKSHVAERDRMNDRHRAQRDRLRPKG